MVALTLILAITTLVSSMEEEVVVVVTEDMVEEEVEVLAKVRITCCILLYETCLGTIYPLDKWSSGLYMEDKNQSLTREVVSLRGGLIRQVSP